ncbi:hypothetical protein D3C83_77070 [compost metagenome]
MLLVARRNAGLEIFRIATTCDDRINQGWMLAKTSCGKRLKGRIGSSPVLKLSRRMMAVEAGTPSKGSAVYLRR